jgi:serine/threonine protein phosphatase PrpC
VDVAIRGDRASCLSLQLGPRSWLFAVARGFGTVDGVAAAPATLERLHAECERRLRTERFRRAVDRVQAAPTAVLGALARVNGELFARSASHADYVTAGCSITLAVIVRGYACVIHTGGTAAYLAHQGEISVLTGDDTLSEAAQELLGRALGASASLDVSVSTVTFDAGDVMILLGHRVRGEVDRRALVSHVERAGENEHLLVVRFDEGDRAIEELGTRDVPVVVYRPHFGARISLLLCALIVGFALVTAWAR